MDGRADWLDAHGYRPVRCGSCGHAWYGDGPEQCPHCGDQDLVPCAACGEPSVERGSGRTLCGDCGECCDWCGREQRREALEERDGDRVCGTCADEHDREVDKHGAQG